jgi:spoIIIJ-associated protein
LTIDDQNLNPQQIRNLIGTDGSVLDAIQYLANSVLNLTQPPEEQASYTIELNGYRVKREAEIRALAEAASQEVRATGREVEIKSLSSAERRQIHTFLKEFSDLETFSRGKEPHRHLVVRPAIAQ